MKERPILMSAPMVRAILAGQKTQTRRVIAKQATHDLYYQRMFGTSPPPNPVNFGTPGLWRIVGPDYPDSKEDDVPCPYGVPGDRLWVRENGWERPERTPMMMRTGADTWEPYYFDADGYNDQDVEDFRLWGFKRRPSIHMPRTACRIVLEVTAMRVERLKQISETDCVAEGCPGGPGAIAGYAYNATPLEHYRWLWQNLNGRDSWEPNPWVWVVEFRRLMP